MPLVELKHADIYQQDKLILSDVTFKIEPTEFVYLIGSTGSGKSSLLKTLYADLPLNKGLAEVVDYQLFDIKKSIIPFLRRKIGIVFQDFQLLTDRTVFDNLDFVLKATGWKNKKEISQRIEEMLVKVGMQDHINKMPYELSGGEQQRICIARALLNKPDLILADEPTGNLDTATSNEIMDLLDVLNNTGRTIVMVTHEPDIAERAKTIVTLRDGLIQSVEQNRS